MEDLLQKNYEKNLELAKNLKPKFSKGDIVRVLKSLTNNTHAIQEFIGSKCEVISFVVNVGIFSEPRIEYMIKFGNRVEPFWEDELDSRFTKGGAFSQK